jgi:hypothetical protein
MTKRPAPDSYAVMDRLLFNYGSGNIDQATFNGIMTANGFTQDAIDAWCTEYYRREHERTKDGTEGDGATRYARGSLQGNNRPATHDEDKSQTHRQGDERQGKQARQITVSGIRELADADDPSLDWEKNHKADGSHRASVIEDGTTIGWYGEKAFAVITGYPTPDRTYKPSGDGGIDFIIPFETPTGRRNLTIDVKAARIPANLICEIGKVRADIYVLAAYVEELNIIRFLGWEWKATVLDAPVRQFRGPPVHAIHNSLLRGMDELFDRMIEVGK